VASSVILGAEKYANFSDFIFTGGLAALPCSVFAWGMSRRRTFAPVDVTALFVRVCESVYVCVRD